MTSRPAPRRLLWRVKPAPGDATEVVTPGARRRAPRRERRRVHGELVLEGDYFELYDGAVLSLVKAVVIEGTDVEVTLDTGAGGLWSTLLRARERVHVWRQA